MQLKLELMVLLSSELWDPPELVSAQLFIGSKLILCFSLSTSDESSRTFYCDH